MKSSKNKTTTPATSDVPQDVQDVQNAAAIVDATAVDGKPVGFLSLAGFTVDLETADGIGTDKPKTEKTRKATAKRVDMTKATTVAEYRAIYAATREHGGAALCRAALLNGTTWPTTEQLAAVNVDENGKSLGAPTYLKNADAFAGRFAAPLASTMATKRHGPLLALLNKAEVKAQTAAPRYGIVGYWLRDAASDEALAAYHAARGMAKTVRNAISVDADQKVREKAIATLDKLDAAATDGTVYDRSENGAKAFDDAAATAKLALDGMTVYVRANGGTPVDVQGVHGITLRAVATTTCKPGSDGVKFKPVA